MKLKEAALCLDCDEVMLDPFPPCPACGGALIATLSTFIDRNDNCVWGERVRARLAAGRSLLDP